MPDTQPRRPREINRLLRTLRGKRKWSQERAATECTWPQPKVCRLETGRQQPTIEDLVKVAEVYGVSLTRLVLLRAA